MKSKVILRPNNTRIMAVHTIEDSIWPGLKHDVLMPKDLAYVKHFRNKGDACEDLLDDRNVSGDAATTHKRVLLRRTRRGEEAGSRLDVLGFLGSGLGGRGLQTRDREVHKDRSVEG